MHHHMVKLFRYTLVHTVLDYLIETPFQFIHHRTCMHPQAISQPIFLFVRNSIEGLEPEAAVHKTIEVTNTNEHKTNPQINPVQSPH